MKYAIYTDSNGFDHVLRFPTDEDRQKFIEWAGSRPTDHEKRAAVDHGPRGAIEIAARDSRVQTAIRSDCWVDERFEDIDAERAV